MNYQIIFTVSAVSVAFSLLLFIFFVKRLLTMKGMAPSNIRFLPQKQGDAP